MELYKEILVHVLAGEEISVTFPHLPLRAEDIVEGECYKALQKIKAAIEDDGLSDRECFQKVEDIVRVFEALGGGGTARHDFG